MHQDTDILIIGAGICGLSMAWHLAKAGKRIAIVEKESGTGRHASGKNAGMLRSLYNKEQLTKWALASKASWPKPLKEAFEETPSLIVGRKHPGHHFDIFCQKKHRNKPAIEVKGDGLFDSKKFISLLCQEVKNLGVQIYFEQEVSKLSGSSPKTNLPMLPDISKSSTQALLTSGTTINAHLAINAAGAFANKFLSKELQAPLSAYARHLFICNARSELLSHFDDRGYEWDENSDWYARKWQKNKILFSVCDEDKADVEHYKSPKNMTEKAAQKYKEVFGEKPDFKESWFCFRTYAPSRLPFTGAASKENSWLFWVAGFGGFGMSCAFGAAKDLSSWILEGKPIHDLNACSLPYNLSLA